jgi:hypothetical protein
VPCSYPFGEYKRVVARPERRVCERQLDQLTSSSESAVYQELEVRSCWCCILSGKLRTCRAPSHFEAVDMQSCSVREKANPAIICQVLLAVHCLAVVLVRKFARASL